MGWLVGFNRTAGLELVDWQLVLGVWEMDGVGMGSRGFPCVVLELLSYCTSSLYFRNWILFTVCLRYIG